jgi:predicted NAD/FAD-dependent oxidoreductase
MTHPTPLVKHRTTPDLPERGNVIIIGSGITGAFAARELIAAGITDVVVLEARDICSGATGRVSRVMGRSNLFFFSTSSCTGASYVKTVNAYIMAMISYI